MNQEIAFPSSICILRLSAIGDVCHAVATVQAIQSKWPQCKISWVIGKVEANLLQDLENIEFIIFDKKAGFKGYRELYQRLKGRKFDQLLHMQVALRSSLATLCIKAKQKWGFDRFRAKEGQWLFTNKQIDVQQQPHVAEGFWAFAKAIGATSEHSPKWHMPINKKAQQWCQQLTANQNYVVISPAASKTERNWTVEGYAKIADYISSKGYQLILSGGPSEIERSLASDIQSLANNDIINLVGNTNLAQLLALLAEAKLVIAPDSGPAHMASSVNTPVVGLYAHSNPGRTGPFNSKHLTVSVYAELLTEQTGKSVADNPWGKRVKGQDLMQRITFDSVVESVNQII